MIFCRNVSLHAVLNRYDDLECHHLHLYSEVQITNFILLQMHFRPIWNQ